MDTVPSISIQGCPVAFPHKAYPSQLSMMSRIIQAIDKKQNCLLESPTGSGKTLSLLCATLAWLKREIDARKRQVEELLKVNELNEGESLINSENCCPICSTSGDGAANYDYESDDSIAEAKKRNKAMNRSEECPLEISDNNDEAGEPSVKRARFHDEDCDDDFMANKKTLNSSFGASSAKQDKLVESRERMEEGEGIEKLPCAQCACHLSALDECLKIKLPKIFYGTRTHNQIGQVIREMKRSEYRDMNMTVLSSRDHTCVHQNVKDRPKKNELCRELLKDSGCAHYSKVSSVKSHNKIKDRTGLEGAWDIEDLLTVLDKVGACPYYTARELIETANIVFCPYNYLIDPSFRDAVGLNLKDDIVIFDEAHNIENISMDAASFDITQEQLESAKTDLSLLITLGINKESYLALRTLIENMLNVIDLTKPRLIRKDFDAASKVWSGLEIVALMNQVGIGPDQITVVRKHFMKIADQERNQDDYSTPKRKKGKVKMDMMTTTLFESLFLCLDFIFKDNMKHRDDYHVALVQSTSYSRDENTETAINQLWLSKRRSSSTSRFKEKQILTLSFWCMNPAVAFEEISKHARTVILTSGTLCPMDSFTSELDVEFPLKLEANHVVRSDQTFIGTIGTAPSGGSLCGTFQNYETFRFQDDLGALILALCKIVPHGVLCFVASYSLSDKLMERWENTGMLDELRRVKRVLVEPRRVAEMGAVINEYYECIESSKNYDSNQGAITGAFMMAVCRGKMSEGQDFSDNNARLVITVGIPYPNIKIPRITLKRSYNDQYQKKAMESGRLLSGSQWYEIQAFRALNQALGRCIRHRQDWGAVIMIDARLNNNPDRYMPSISKWMRQRVKHFHSFWDLLHSMKGFVARRKELVEAGEVEIHAR